MKAFLKAVADWAAPRGKALTAGAIAALLAYLKLSTDGMSSDDWELVIGLLLAGTGFTYAVPNAKQPTK